MRTISRGGPLAAIFLAISVISIASRYSKNANDEQAARAFVEQGYAAAQSGGESEDVLSELWLRNIRKQYGRVLHYKITGTRWKFEPQIYAFTVDVQHERGATHEVAEVRAGRSRIQGTYSISMHTIRVE